MDDFLISAGLEQGVTYKTVFSYDFQPNDDAEQLIRLCSHIKGWPVLQPQPK